MTESIDSKINNPPENQSFQEQSKKKERPKLPKSAKLHKFFYGAFLGLTLASCSRLDAAFQDPAERDQNPMVQQAYQIYKEDQARNSYEDEIATVEPLATHSVFEIPSSEQRILPGVRVRVVGTGGDGLRVRSEAGLISDVLKVVPDGTTFKVIELAGEKDGYTWVYAIPENGQPGGYIAVEWLQVIADQAIQ